MAAADALLDSADATEVARAIRDGEVSARDMTDAAIGRIEDRNPTLNAVISTRFDEARTEADRVDAEGVDPSGQPFAGVPFVIKDLGAAIAGLPHTRGSRLWMDDVATEDTELVRRYRAAGFVVLGTTNSPELGKNASTEPVLHGATHNPHDLDRSPGGSSGGTAAAIAGGMVPIGHGNDGGGSIRIPASACGLVGLKPSRARTTAAPERSLLSYPMGINHVLTRSVRDTAHVLDLTAGPVLGDPFVIPPPDRPWLEEVADGARGEVEPLVVGMNLENRDGDAVDPQCAAATEAAARTLEDLGHRVVEAGPTFPLDKMLEVMMTGMGVPLAINVNRRLAELGRPLADDDLEPFTRLMYESATEVTGERALTAMQLVEEIGQEVGAFWGDHDVYLSPTIQVPAPPLGLLDTTDIDSIYAHASKYAAQTSVFNTTGQPAISLPLAHDDGGVPIGVQFVGAFGREDLLIRLAAQIEAATPWSTETAWSPPTA